MWGRATLAMEVSRTSMNVARVTVRAMAQRLARGFQTVTGAAVAGMGEVWVAALICWIVWLDEYRDGRALLRMQNHSLVRKRLGFVKICGTHG